MQIPQTLPQFTETPVLIAVVGRERGILYLALNGIVEPLIAVNEPSARYSDREGFFMHAGPGMYYGSGEPYRSEEVQARNRFITKVIDDLRKAIATSGARKICLFEPIYLKGDIAKALRPKTAIEVELVDHGNFLYEKPIALIQRIVRHETPAYDPADPASVAGERHAKEKRKILEVGARLRG